ncbi:MYB DNA-binding domain-containing protein [Colletotrichum higginsianum]|nr:MYB DNA-binding domain-containing protein [Colletotrichum higginsianum]
MPAAPAAPTATPIPPPAAPAVAAPPAQTQPAATEDAAAAPQPPPAKKSRTNTPWTPAEELRLKQMRDAGSSWAEIAKVRLVPDVTLLLLAVSNMSQTFPTRTEGSVKKHWYKDMHYAEFAEDESQALLNAIKEYENNKWKVIGQKVGKPAKACEQYAKEHFPDLYAKPANR